MHEALVKLTANRVKQPVPSHVAILWTWERPLFLLFFRVDGGGEAEAAMPAPLQAAGSAAGPLPQCRRQEPDA